jgi:Terminase large subunit, ATPase domain
VSRPARVEPARDLLARWRADRMAFRREAILLEDGRPLGEVMDPWQADDFRALDDPAHRHAYLERPRGHSKTGDLGTEAVTELVLGRPAAQLFCAAADEDQARLLLEDVRGKFERSPMLKPLVRYTRTEIIVKTTGSRLRVLSGDAPSAYGLRPDWIAVDELAEWRTRGLWDSLWTATGKRPACRMLVISTAGWDRTGIAWEVRQIAERERSWYFASRGPCASWIDPAWRAQQQRTLPAHVFARLHLNQWVEGVGAFLTAAEVDGIFAATCRRATAPAPSASTSAWRRTGVWSPSCGRTRRPAAPSSRRSRRGPRGAASAWTCATLRTKSAASPGR